MKKLLLSMLIPFSAFPAVQYNTETKMYSSTKNIKSINPVRYHILAEYCSLLLENAINTAVDIYEVIQHIKEMLVCDNSPEADLLYDDLSEIFEEK